MRQRTLCFLVLPMLLLAACAASPAPGTLSPAENAQALDRRTLEEQRLRQFVSGALGYPNTSFQWDLPSLSLAALYYHPDLDVAYAKAAKAEAGVVTAGEPPNPTLNFATVFGQAAVAGAITPGAAPVTIGPVINFIVETFGKREDRTAQAKDLARAARWDVATAGWRVRGGVRAALLDYWAAQERLTLTNCKLTLQTHLVGLIEDRFDAGEASGLDVSRERVALVQVTLAVRDLENAQLAARVQLAAAIGIPAAALEGVELSPAVFDRPAALPAGFASGELRRVALTQRPDVQASLAKYEAAQAALALEVANRYPNLSLGPGYNYDFGVNKYQLALGADLPIFHQNQGPIAEALAKRQEAEAAFTALQAEIIAAVDQAATALQNADRSLAASETLLADEQRRAARVEKTFKAGQTDRPSLVMAQFEAATAALARFDAVVRQRQALGALEDALQKPLFAPQEWPAIPAGSPRSEPRS
jgi:outer membrane protein, heavy metal efflux system